MYPSTKSLELYAEQLLQETVTLHLSPTARVVEVETVPLPAGLSGAPVQRHQVTLEHPSGARDQVWLVTKEAWFRERRVLAWLNAQRQASVPFSHTLDLETDAPAPVCMQDVGDTRRPSSLDPITDEALQAEARGLAAIHAANLGRGEALDWLPRIDRSYFAGYVIAHCWRPHWQKAVANPAFRQQFGGFIPKVETAANRMVDEMSAVAAEPQCQTLVHTDINPSNVLVHRGRPFYIDWQVAHYGPFYMDLPHHFCTREQAEHYRAALAALGREIPAPHFTDRYRAAARCIGFRYLWWTLEGWHGKPDETAWVQHYLGLILG